jgi:hypothetical protein
MLRYRPLQAPTTSPPTAHDREQQKPAMAGENVVLIGGAAMSQSSDLT